jgi:hypothetical protein
MRVLAVWTSLATIVTLNVVIGLGLLGSGVVPSSSDALLYAWMLTALHVVLPISSVLMFALLVKDRQWTGAALFAAIIAGMLVVMTLRLTGPKLSLGVHLAGDLCVLNVYLIVVTRHLFNLPRSGRPKPLQAASPTDRERSV